jgi:hypothetical protein
MPAAIVIVPSNFSIPAGVGTGSGGSIFIVVTTIGPPLVFAHHVDGIAATPTGFRFDVWRTRRLYPFFQADGGLIKSAEPVPYTANPVGTSVNFLTRLFLRGFLY